ncbi:DUF4236 domain-containing protein [Streptomyces sp. SL13]|uniref:DUF4236 domain-containing protein n=1 Tax=Streptantibioticus silvisoli TaxID=2705255 RepID=A0AA90GY36_9ACTN|nr:DUF4236 domain-containing protein [Streptantibioticus silvisoli]MDI5969909.1 DUF4236 domain-containing protein [Streptantibioticus silvisoli]
MARRRSLSKSINLGGGVRVRVGSKSSSISVGGKNGRVTLNSNGRRTTTVRAGGMSVTSTSMPEKRVKQQRVTAAPTRSLAPEVWSARLGTPIGPRRKIHGGWVAADDRGLVIHREGQDDVRVPHRQITQVWLEDKHLALMATDMEPMRLRLTTLFPSWDLRFVNAVARAAGLDSA